MKNRVSDLNSPVTLLNKGLGHFDQPLAPEQIAGLHWNLLREDLSLPSAVLYQEKLLHNLDWMQQFITSYGVKLAPHGKTTMTPALFNLQLKAGAWGITLATAHQTLVAYQHGVRRVLMANQLVGKQNMATIARLLADPAFEYFCLVDSPELVEQLGAFFEASGKRLNVLIELGFDGGRTGIRNPQQLQSVLDALARWREHLALCGVEIYEGVLEEEETIREFLRHAVSVTRDLMQAGRFDREPVILSGAGSSWYDVVADVFSSAGFGDAVEVILRPGCYLSHDAGICNVAQEKIMARNPIALRMHSSLKPALQLWAYVQSIPEKEKAILALGKRDVSFDAGLPVPVQHYRPGSAVPATAPTHWMLTKMMDQHAYLHIAEGDDIRPGDMIAFDISHPCLTFDKWKWLPVLDAGHNVIDVVQTFF